MPRRRPPIRALEVFEAAARHLSFKSAAEELFLTPSAVTRHVQTLEERLGAQLFERRNRTVSLTSAGEELARETGTAFSALREVLDRFNGQDRVLRISVAPFFSAGWLMPRLPAFEAAHPEVELLLSANEARGQDVGPLERLEVDACILHGRPEQWPGCDCIPLGKPMQFLPVCSSRGGVTPLPPDQPSRLAALTWLDNGMTPWLWDWYVAQLGVPGLQPAKRESYNAFPMYREAIAQGRGVALVPVLGEARQAVADGRLRVVLDRPLAHPDYNYYLVQPRDRRPKVVLRTFEGWLSDQICRGD